MAGKNSIKRQGGDNVLNLGWFKSIRVTSPGAIQEVPVRLHVTGSHFLTDFHE